MTTNPWVHDRLNRQADGNHLIAVMLSRYASRKAGGTGSYIMNIDAAWGEGKSFFIDCLAQDLRNRGHPVATVNAWQDDHADDPLITIMAAIETTLAPYLPEQSKAAAAFGKAKRTLGIVAAETGKQVAYHALKTVTGIAVEKTMARLQAAGALETDLRLDDDAFDDSAALVWEKSLENLVGERVAEQRRINDAIAAFRAQTAEAIKHVVDKGLVAPLFVFVDELDRCRPPYAIKLLENLKHLFDIDGLVFVVATDSTQLAHSVKAIYGADFEARKYLRRFFDRVFVFPEAERGVFLKHVFDAAGIDIDRTFYPLGEISPLQHMQNWANGLRLSNRDVVQIVEIIVTFVTSFEHPCMIEPNLLLGLATAFYNRDDATFAYLSGRGPETKDMAGWSVEYREYGSGRDVIRKLEPGDLLNRISVAADDRLETITQGTQEPYKRYFEHEMAERLPQGYVSRGSPRSVLTEYTSRVRNAGRVTGREPDR